jgi:glutamate--cysteine ligase
MNSQTPIEDKAPLVEYLESGARPAEDWRIGTEHEKFVYTWNDHRPLPYEGPPGIGELLDTLAKDCGWTAQRENGRIIALQRQGGSITLEPGGQLELSGAPLSTLHQTCQEVHDHLRQVKQVARVHDVGFLGMGFAPDWTREQMPWMPKGRYKIMGDYMPKVGTLGLDMMLRTATVQVNLDFDSEADMVAKFRTALALQPLATILFANSPFTEGKPNGYKSWRSMIWRDTDADRCGMLPFVFDAGMGYERWADYLLDVPMYFVRREGRFIDASGQSFRDFLAGNLPALPGERPTLDDWTDHMTTVFPEVRLKRFLEMRGADAGPWSNLCALPAFWVGLLYDRDAQQAAWSLVKDWDMEARQRFRDEAPRDGLATHTPFGSARDLAREVLAVADEGLRRRGHLNARGQDERLFLKPLWESVESGRTPADVMLAKYHGEWGGDIQAIYREYAY